jgi:hypothetical protein
MSNRGIQSLFAILLVLVLTSSGVCAIFSLADRESTCRKNKPFKDGILAPASKSCKVLPCSTGKISVFILPDSRVSKIERINQDNYHTFHSYGIWETLRYSCASSRSGIYHLNLLRADSPSFFIMNCAFLC